LVEAIKLRKPKTLSALFITAFMLSIAAFTFVPAVQKTSASPDEIVVITPHWSGITDMAAERFTAWYSAKTGNDVVITFDYKDTVASLSLIREANGDPAKVKWDVWWGGGLEAFRIAKDEGLLAPFYLLGDSEWEDINSNIPESFAGLPMKDMEDYMWWGAALSGFGIVYNLDYLATYNLPVPNDWIDLADPVYKGHIISCPPSKSGSNLMIIQIILQYYGWQDGWALVTKMGGNIAEYTEKSQYVGPYIGRGEYGVAAIIDQYGFGQAAVYPDSVVFFYPPANSTQKDTVINPDSVAIVKGKGDTNPVAVEFMKWCLGEDGQSMLFLDPIDRLPVRTDVYAEAPSGYFNPFEAELTLTTYNDTLGTLRLDIVKDMFDMLLIGAKDSLVSAWTTYNTAKDFITRQQAAGYSLPNAQAQLEEAYTAFTSLPINSQEVETLSPTYLDLREEYKAEWLDFAVNKYADTVTLSQQALETARSESVALLESLQGEIDALQATATNNLYYGLAGGIVVGLIVGALAIYMLKPKG
jgi:phosphoglycerate transport regulatory protein PgtC